MLQAPKIKRILQYSSCAFSIICLSEWSLLTQCVLSAPNDALFSGENVADEYVTTFDADVHLENKTSQYISCVTLSTVFQQGNILWRICARISFRSVYYSRVSQWVSKIELLPRFCVKYPLRLKEQFYGARITPPWSTTYCWRNAWTSST
jgi:hypothetical protein